MSSLSQIGPVRGRRTRRDVGRRPGVRTWGLAAALMLFTAPAAQAAEIRILTPLVTFNAGLKDLVTAFTEATGIKATLMVSGMSKIIEDASTVSPAPDVIIVPMDLMGTMSRTGHLEAHSFAPLGRVEIGLAVKAGAPHPDISTVPKLAAALRSAEAVLYTNPTGGGMAPKIIQAMLDRPEFAGVPSRYSSRGEGGQALKNGEGDMALQLVCEILPYKEIALVGPLPRELGAHIDSAVAVSARAADPKSASAFVAYILTPEAAAVWKAKGLDRF